MKDRHFELRLENALKELEKASAQVLKTKSYVDDVKRLKILEELIKEQLSNENSRHTAREIG